MAAEASLYSLLTGTAGVTALVSTRIYPDLLPENCAYPAIVFARSNTDPLIGISGQVFGTDIELSIGCWAATRTSADAVASAVEAAIAGSDFYRVTRSAVADPDSGLLGTNVTVTLFETA